MKKRVPRFKSEAEEQEFRATASSAEYIDWKEARQAVLSKLTPSLRTISLRLPAFILEELELLANQRDVPYQSLLKVYLAERIAKGRKASSALRPGLPASTPPPGMAARARGSAPAAA